MTITMRIVLLRRISLIAHVEKDGLGFVFAHIAKNSGGPFAVLWYVALVRELKGTD